MKGTKTNEKIFWDSRARSYPLPFASANYPKTRRMIHLLARQGVRFKGRTVLDIGCGTGAYALNLAGSAARTFGVDSSAAMLRIFRRERRLRGIDNSSCALADWSALPKSKTGRFDIALASMTAAIKTSSDILKMEAASREYCVYIGWAGIRRNPLLEKIYAAHGLEYKAPEGAERTLKILKALGRLPKTTYLRDSWTKEASVKETLREIAVSMKVNGVRLKKRWTESFVESRARGGKVRQLTKVRKAAIIWRPPGTVRKEKRTAR